LNKPEGGYKISRQPFSKGGEWGNREEKINDLIPKIL
jgi:hypothetical protein